MELSGYSNFIKMFFVIIVSAQFFSRYTSTAIV